MARGTSSACSSPSARRCRRGPIRDPAEPAAIFFTSGSTGPAKGVTHTRDSLRWMIASAAAAFELDASDVFLPGSSMSHVGSFLWALSTLSVGGRVVVARTFDSHELLPLLREHQPTVLAMIPAALLALVRDHDLQPEDFASLRVCRCGSDKVSSGAAPVRRRRRLPDRRGLRDDRGRPGDAEPALGRGQTGSIGRPISGFSIALRGEEGEPVGAEAVGRIFIRTPAAWPATGKRPLRIGYKAPEEILFLDEMPLNPTGKIDRTGLKRMAEDHLHPHGLER